MTTIRQAVAVLGDDWAVAFERDGFCQPMRDEIRDFRVMQVCDHWIARAGRRRSSVLRAYWTDVKGDCR